MTIAQLEKQTTYTLKASHIQGELALQLDETRVTGLSGTEGLIVYTEEGPYFVQAYRNKEKVRRDDLNESTHGLLELTVKKAVKDLKSTGAVAQGLSIQIPEFAKYVTH